MSCTTVAVSSITDTISNGIEIVCSEIGTVSSKITTDNNSSWAIDGSATENVSNAIGKLACQNNNLPVTKHFSFRKWLVQKGM